MDDLPIWLVHLLVALAAGLAAALVAWAIGSGASEVPPEDRRFKDPPPLPFRWIWWVIRWVAHGLGGLMPARLSQSVQSALRKAGLDFSLDAAQFLASRVVCAAFCALFAGVWLQGFSTAGVGLATSLQVALAAALMGWAWPALWLRDRLAARRKEILKTLPFFLDVITLCVEAGLNLQGACQQAALKAPAGALKDEFQRALRDIRAGMQRAAALRAMAERLQEPGINSFVTSVIQAEAMGMNLGPVLRAQAEQRRSERFLRAEKLAMQAPVKMLLPLIAFIFPCTFIVLFFPIVMKFMHSGI